jgi:hypothetical protein
MASDDFNWLFLTTIISFPALFAVFGLPQIIIIFISSTDEYTRNSLFTFAAGCGAVVLLIAGPELVYGPRRSAKVLFRTPRLAT